MWLVVCLAAGVLGKGGCRRWSVSVMGGTTREAQRCRNHGMLRDDSACVPAWVTTEPRQAGNTLYHSETSYKKSKHKHKHCSISHIGPVADSTSASSQLFTLDLITTTTTTTTTRLSRQHSTVLNLGHQWVCVCVCLSVTDIDDRVEPQQSQHTQSAGIIGGFFKGLVLAVARATSDL